MNRLSVILFGTILLVAHLSAQGSSSPSAPLTRAMVIEATRLAASQRINDLEWERVKALKFGDELVVVLTDATVHGRFASADGLSLTLRTPALRSMTRDSIHAVRRASGQGSKLAAAIGGVFGSIVGLALASNVDWGECGCGGFAIVPVGIAVGAGVGGYYLFRGPPETIYER